MPKKEVYVGEVLAVEFQVYVREGVANAENILQSFDQYGGCPLKVEGVSIIKTAHAQRRRMRVGNAIYGVATLVTSLSPVKTGPLTIGSMDVNLTLQLPLPNQRRRDPFDPFGMFQQVEERRVVLSARTRDAHRAAAAQGEHPGQLQRRRRQLLDDRQRRPDQCRRRRPRHRARSKSPAAARSTRSPCPSKPPGAISRPTRRRPRWTPPTRSGCKAPRPSSRWSCRKAADIKALPPVSFSFFDPDQKQYRTLTQPAVPLVVRPGGSAPAPTVAPPPAPRRTIRRPRRTSSTSSRAWARWPRSPRRWCNSPGSSRSRPCPLLAWLSAVVWRRRAEMLANNPRLRRHRQVAQIIRQGLVELRQLAADNKSDDFFATLVRLLQEQLGERLDLPASAITEAVIEEHLRPRGVPETTLAPLHELFQTCNLARYAPIRISQELAAIIPKLEAVLRDLQELKL